jgi:hypothetical protein
MRSVTSQIRPVHVAIAAAAVLATARFIYSGIYWPVTNGAWGQLALEELPPLFGLVLRGEEIKQIDPRQYGVVVFIVAHLLLLVGSGGMRALELGLLAVGHMAVFSSLIFVWLALSTARDLRTLGALALLWYTFTPVYQILGVKNVESWQLSFLSAGFLAYVGARSRPWSGAAAAAGMMTKVLPVIVLAFLTVRDRRTLLAGALTTLGLILLGQLLYGPLMGFGYLPHLAFGAQGVTQWLAGWHDSESLRAIVYKVASGFRLENYLAAVPPATLPLVVVTSNLLAALAMLYLVFVGWHGRRLRESRERLAVEFSVAVLVMLLVSPVTPHEYMIMALPAYATAFWLLLRRYPQRWPLTAQAALASSLALVGTIVPMKVVVALLPLDILVRIAGVPLDESQAYRHFLFPAVGLLMLVAVMVWLEWVTRRRFAEGESPAPTTPDLGRVMREASAPRVLVAGSADA